MIPTYSDVLKWRGLPRRILLTLIERGPMSESQIAQAVRDTTVEVVRHLTALYLAGVIIRENGGWGYANMAELEDWRRAIEEEEGCT